MSDLTERLTRTPHQTSGPSSVELTVTLTAGELRDLIKALEQFPIEAPRTVVDPEAIVSSINGSFEFSDGTVTRFSTSAGSGWQQWGSQPHALGRSSDLMDQITQAAYEAGHLRDLEEERARNEEGTAD